MSKKNNKSGIVYSTNPDFRLEEESFEAEALPPQQQKLRVIRETKHRAGKAMTVVTGFVGPLDQLEAVGKQLKNFCGTGGSVKEGEILIQGDQAEKVLQWLLKQGYSQTKRSGG